MLVKVKEKMAVAKTAADHAWAKASVAGLVLAASASARADGITDLLDGIDLAGVAAKIGSVALVVVAIYLTIQGISVAKRVISKV